MRYRLFSVFAALSLVLCVALAGLWGRSYWWADLIGMESAVGAEGRQRGGTVSSAGGGVCIALWGRQYIGQPAPSVRASFGRISAPRAVGKSAAAGSAGGGGFLGFSVTRQTLNLQRPRSDGRPTNASTPQSVWTVSMPYWFAVVLAALPPMAWWLQYRRRKRRAGLTLCPACGYDLRASKERCPECGRAIVPQR